MKTLFVSAVALIDADQRILLAERPPGKPMAGLFEFPGGKLEAGEGPEEALLRETEEELGVRLCVSCLSPGPFVSYIYRETPPPDDPTCHCPGGDPYFVPASRLGLAQECRVVLMLYLCRRWEGTPAPREGQRLVWRHVPEMDALPMPPADRPLVAALRVFL